MDGNGRWARSRGYPRFYGHVRGAVRVKEIVRTSREIGIRALTLYAFSTENWARPEEELQVLWKILRKYLKKEAAELKRQGVRLQVIGEIDRLPPEAARELRATMEFLAEGTGMDLTFALSYGGRSEIVNAARSLAARVASGSLDPLAIDDREFASHLATAPLGDAADVDLLIRTSGEKRVSNFLLWQISYAEFDFVEKNWPDYTADEYQKSLEAFGKRKRRFGAV